jgi:hypothetical protein
MYARDSTTSEFISFTNPSWSIAFLVKFLLVSKWVTVYALPSAFRVNPPWLYRSTLISTSWADDAVHGQISDRSPYIEAVSYLTQISLASVTDWILIP